LVWDGWCQHGAAALKKGHNCVVFDRSPKTVDELAKEKAAGALRSKSWLEKLAKPRAIWLMVPAAVLTARSLICCLTSMQGDILIDGGNFLLRGRTSGGQRNSLPKRSTMWMWAPAEASGAWSELCMMIGGETEIIKRLDPIFATLAPGGDIPRSVGREKIDGNRRTRLPALRPKWGAGHFVKMVHNGMEYRSDMAAYAEGLAILRSANRRQVKRTEQVDAETRAP